MQNLLFKFSPLSMQIGFWSKESKKEEILKGRIKMEFGNEKFCIGYSDENGHHPCPRRAAGSKQCAMCASRDIAKVYTHLNSAGYESFFEKYNKQSFSVYLASFGHVVKCGVTRATRLEERVKEQGADYFCEIARTEDAKTAYTIEKAIHQNFSFIRNGLTSAQKLKLMKAQASTSTLEQCIAEVEASGLISEFKGTMSIKKLHYPVPSEFTEAENINGKIIGAKGQILFYKHEDSYYAVNMSKKIGTMFDYSLIGS